MAAVLLSRWIGVSTQKPLNNVYQRLFEWICVDCVCARKLSIIWNKQQTMYVFGVHLANLLAYNFLHCSDGNTSIEKWISIQKRWRKKLKPSLFNSSNGCVISKKNSFAFRLIHGILSWETRQALNISSILTSITN